ncbi:MAG: hypothetical protein ACOCP4_02730 [Candidatus Woesearchaeota archaeon]
MARNYDVYYSLMGKAIEEKIDFIVENLEKDDKSKTIVDFGCGDGLLIKTLSHIFPHKNFVGIDKPEIVHILIKESFEENVFYMTAEDFTESEFHSFREYSIIFSSVLHEIFTFHYEPLEFIYDIAKDAISIFIRDMLFTDSGFSFDIPESLGENEQLNQMITQEKMDSNINRLMAHFLLKQRYKENWKEELKEDYFSIPYYNLHNTFNDVFVTTHYEPYMNDFLYNDIKQKLDIDLKRYTLTTHIKLIFTHKKYL